MSANQVQTVPQLSLVGSMSIQPAEPAKTVTLDDIPDLPLTDNKLVGGAKSGEPFLSRKGNKIIKSVKFWSADNRLVAVEITWHGDESTETYGDASKGTESKLLSLDVEEIVEYASLWKTEEGNAVAYIELQTNGVQFFGFGTKPDNIAPVKENVGNGYLVALTGTAGDVIESLGLQFMSGEVKAGSYYLVTDWKVKPSPSDIENGVAVQQDFRNNTNEETTWSFNERKEYISTQEWKKSSTEQFGADASVTGGFLGISFGGGASWSESTTEEHGRSWSKDHTFGWDIGSKLKPGEAVRVTAWVFEGRCNLEFTYLIGFEFNGSILWWATPVTGGRYKGMLFSKGEVTVDEIPN